MRPNNRLEHLVSAAEQEVASGEFSASERTRIEQIRKVISAFKLPHYHPSTSIKDRAKAIFEPKAGLYWSKLSRHTLGLSGARSGTPTSFQVEFTSEVGTGRLEYRPTSGGWLVLGQLSQDGWTGHCEGGKLRMMGDRFELMVPAIADAEITLTKEEEVWVIPAIDEAFDEPLGDH